MDINNFNIISIRGRFIYGYLCLVNAINYIGAKELPTELDILYHEFVSGNKLDFWHTKVEDILPSFILDVEQIDNDFFPKDLIEKIKHYYQELPLFAIETIENLFWLGISNMYVAFNSVNSLNYLKSILNIMDEQSIPLPDFEKIRACSINQKNGWGEFDDLGKYQGQLQ